MAQITTHTGDDGTTGLMGPNRVRKDDAIIEALGALDEAQAAIGLARSFARPEISELLFAVQRELYRVMGEVATAGQPKGEETAREHGMRTLPDHVDALEADVLRWRESLPSAFIIPGATPFDGAIHVARSLARRAERRIVTLLASGAFENQDTQRYVNRLSDWLFVLAQHELEAPAALARACG
jgi:cob(I)alamin adenosyltransferase